MLEKQHAGSPVLHIDRVNLTLGGHEILRDINLSIREGEFVCVVGPSGCGKTTMLRLLAGLYQPTSGDVTYRSTRMTHPRQDIAIVFQDYGKALLPWRTAHGNVSLAFEALNAPREGRDDKIEQLLAKVGLGGQGKKYPNQLSGGQREAVCRPFQGGATTLFLT